MCGSFALHENSQNLRLGLRVLLFTQKVFIGHFVLITVLWVHKLKKNPHTKQPSVSVRGAQGAGRELGPGGAWLGASPGHSQPGHRPRLPVSLGLSS